jgi:hypothetical protein
MPKLHHPDVRFGSLADVGQPVGDVRFGAESGHLQRGHRCLLSAISRRLAIAQQNVSSGFDLAKSLATAKTFAEMVELRATYWLKQLSALSAQAEEVRALSTKVAADVAAPIKAHVTRSIGSI